MFIICDSPNIYKSEEYVNEHKDCNSKGKLVLVLNYVPCYENVPCS